MCIRTISQSSTCILYDLPLGKPNPSEKKELGNDMRNRIDVEPKFKSGYYHAVNCIRDRIGKNPCDELKEKRKFELNVAVRKKQFAVMDRPFNRILEVAISCERILISDLPNNEQEEIRATVKELNECELKNEIEVASLLFKKRFQKHSKIDLNFFKSCEINIEELFNSEMTPENGYSGIHWSDHFSEHIEGARMLDFLALKVIATQYGFKKTPWTPSDTIELFHETLLENGVMLACGIFGQAAYQVEPLKIEKKFYGQDIYYWPKNAPKMPYFHPYHYHSCVVTGVKITKKGRGYVFFIDPSEPSGPTRPPRKIYIALYETFKKQCFDLHGRAYSQSYFGPGFTKAPPNSNAGYGYHGNLPINRIPDSIGAQGSIN